jgi:hypothetical protein
LKIDKTSLKAYNANNLLLSNVSDIQYIMNKSLLFEEDIDTSSLRLKTISNREKK